MRGHIAPLFWHHGEPADVIIREIEAMHSSGIGEFIVEPRPHPDFLGPHWWSDVDVILAAARQRDMRVWFFDDALFPSGWLNGILPAQHPNMLKRYLGERHVDVQGPMSATSFALSPWLQEGDELHAVVAGRRRSDDVLDSDTLTDVTAAVVDGTLYWDVPEGRWRVSIIIETSRGQEPETSEYLNPVAEGAAELHLATVHEAHFERYGDDFGGLIAGFFQDEPRFGNARAYEFRLGQTREQLWGRESSYVLPYSELVWRRLQDRWGDRARRFLPLLWWEGEEELTARTRFGYMDVLTRIYETFQRTLGAWCESHRVSLIGHVVEDNGAHARLGYGAGHYFRAMAGQHMGGIDLVQHVRPGASTGRRAGSFGSYDDDFYFWGLSKLASSAAHIDPKKRGLAMSEAFGAYGWHEGLRLMKWLTDHMAVRGINFLVPHAFSPRTWDLDCPPHFFNGGLNPQWVHFPVWRAYAERLSEALSGGEHVSDAAVLYHAEAEWAGEYQPFERAIAELQKAQRDADVVPIDAVLGGEVTADGGLRIGSETYPVLIVPYSQRLPEAFIAAVLDRGIRVLFVDALPTALADTSDLAMIERLRAVAEVVPLAVLADRIDGPISTSNAEPDLRVMRYRKRGALSLFVVNESTERIIDTELNIREATGAPVIVDPLLGTRSLLTRLRLEPGESRFVEFTDAEELAAEPRWTASHRLPDEGWSISVRSFDPAGGWTVADFDTTGAVNVVGRLPRLAGTIRYERRVDLKGVDAIDLGDVGEVAELLVDGVSRGVRIAGPYRFELARTTGVSNLTIDVTTTLAPLMAHRNVFDATVALEPTGLLGPVTAERRDL